MKMKIKICLLKNNKNLIKNKQIVIIKNGKIFSFTRGKALFNTPNII